ncbi:conserved hypothetical protein [Burkholderia multivorans ATCC 17616]|uniref:Uncharacterized protein n=1 Tax=Burkholderia multivorans (strain ATCC 17616 / 249) TaxID=395019 RepID=A0A0H3KG24_BURM1|nr:conserved hypothetical protein [Burkholderia multivorans ATCC 17616]
MPARPAARGRGPARGRCAAYHIATVKPGIRDRALCAARASAILPPCASADGRRRTPKTASTPGNRARAFERTQAPERAATQRSNGFVSAPASGRGQTDAENA